MGFAIFCHSEQFYQLLIDSAWPYGSSILIGWQASIGNVAPHASEAIPHLFHSAY